MKNAVWTWLQRVPLVAAMRGHAKALKGSKGKGSPAPPAPTQHPLPPLPHTIHRTPHKDSLPLLKDRTKDIEDVVRVFVFKHRTVELEHCGRAHRGDPVGKFQAVCKTHTAIPFNNRIVAIGQSLAEILVQGRMESRGYEPWTGKGPQTTNGHVHMSLMSGTILIQKKILQRPHDLFFLCNLHNHCFLKSKHRLLA
ncbi:hypothetical protein V6N12_070778 [Hibiscus sabdariffa]|uniref:Uncharacterized protein n=1 Tax=Hibiscus sabdariffa TaxID=183260 RepID=A0ABR2FHU6_9ROSI